MKKVVYVIKRVLSIATVEIDNDYLAKNKIDINVNHLFLKKNRYVGNFDYSNINNIVSIPSQYVGDKCIELAGDCFFNFNEKKYDVYMHIINNTKNTNKEEKKKQLNY